MNRTDTCTLWKMYHYDWKLAYPQEKHCCNFIESFMKKYFFINSNDKTNMKVFAVSLLEISVGA